MIFRWAADSVALVHFFFVVFASLGCLLALRWPRVIWLQIPAAIWGATIEFGGWICPLTPFENWLRLRGGSRGYSGGFVETYILPILYPAGLTRDIQIALGVIVVVVNIAVYSWILVRRSS